MRLFIFFFFNDTATTEIYTLSLHDALPISLVAFVRPPAVRIPSIDASMAFMVRAGSSSSGVARARSITSSGTRSEEHTSELQSRQYLVCRLLLEKKKKNIYETLKCR